MILNLFFPLWMILYFNPLFIFISLIVNIAIDTAIVAFFVKRTNLHLINLKSNIVKTIVLGFVADITGGVLLIFIYGIPNFRITYFEIWGNPLSILVHSLAILFVGVLIFLFNMLNYRSSELLKTDVVKLSLLLAVITMPYTFLISSSLFN